MKLSIIIPCYNVQQYLPECLDSVFNQYFEGLEVIAVNDGSPDNSIDILREYEATYPGILKIIDQENGGISNARNNGIAMSSGEYICVLDSDDKVADGVLLRAYEICKSNDLQVLYGRADAFHDDAPEEYEDWYSDTSFLDGSTTDVMTGAEALNMMWRDKSYRSNAWLEMIKRDFLMENGIQYIDGITYECGPYSYEVFLKAERVVIDNNIFVHYRLRDGSITHAKPTGKMVHDLLVSMIRKMELFEEYASQQSPNNGIYKRVVQRREFASVSYSRLSKREKAAFHRLCTPREEMYFRTVLRHDVFKRAKIKELNRDNSRLAKENASLKKELEKALAANMKLKSSTTYRVGRILTAPFRKLKKLFKG